MEALNIEIKAKCSNQNTLRKMLTKLNADFIGIDHQIDTYFNVNSGRLKLREGNIEHFLIHYQRENTADPKASEVLLHQPEPNSSLKKILTKALGILVIVDKQREIYFIDNVKFHLDVVDKLGTFVEIEAIDNDGSIGREKLLKQCNYYLKLFEISETDLLAISYSDMLIRKKLIF